MSGNAFFSPLVTGIQIRESDKRVVEADMFGTQTLDVIFDIFRIGGDDRAIVVVACLRKLGALIRDARVENVFDAFFYQATRRVRVRALPDSIPIHSGWIRYRARRFSG